MSKTHTEIYRVSSQEANPQTEPDLVLHTALLKASKKISFHTSGNKAERRDVGFENLGKAVVNA